MVIRRLMEQDAPAVSELIITTIRISNVGDYSTELMEELVKTQTPEHVLQRASWTHFYVAEEAGAIIGCGAIGPYWGKEDESSLFSIFVHPDHQGKGIGRAIVETLEKDEYALRARRIEIPASITGLPFYRKMGYSFKNGNAEIDEEQLYRLEKYRSNGMNYTIRKVTIEDYDALFELWSSTEQSRRALNPVDDSREGIARYLKRNPDTCFAAVQGDRMIGVILTGHDGRRGMIHHMCVHPDFRRMGIAACLVSAAEEALKKEGIQKVFGLVFIDNEAANAFWEKQGYSLRTNLNYRNKSLNASIPTGE